MKEKDILTVTIVDDNHLGNGIAKKDDLTIFVPQTTKDDVVEIKVNKISKKIANADVVKYITKSNNHQNVKCPYYDKCGGCDLLHIPYDREKELKEKYIKKLMKDFDLSIVSFNREKYRNKVTLHVSNNSLGYYKKDSNSLIPINHCLLLSDSINKTIEMLKNINLDSIKEIVIKDATGVLVSIYGSISKQDLEYIKKDPIKSIYINDKLAYGEEYLKIRFKNIIYNINSESFFQINNECAEALYKKIKEEVGSCDSLLDLYCGTGSIGLYLHENVKHITGIEINKNSVKCAKKNIIDNNIKNYTIINADASKIGKKNYDVVIVDPPRSGLSKEVINIINKMDNKKVIYISCNPSTLKRDLDILTKYVIKDISVFNMFPGTKHIETLVVLERQN